MSDPVKVSFERDTSLWRVTVPDRVLKGRTGFEDFHDARTKARDVAKQLNLYLDVDSHPDSGKVFNVSIDGKEDTAQMDPDGYLCTRAQYPVNKTGKQTGWSHYHLPSRFDLISLKV